MQRVFCHFRRRNHTFFPSQDKPAGPAPQNNSESNSSDENGCKSVQVSQTAKSERIKELKEQVDSLQNVILQVSIMRAFDRQSVPK